MRFARAAGLCLVPLCLALGGLVAGCSPAATGLAPALTARMDDPGATLDRREALALVNSYRAGSGGGALAGDAGLDAQASELAAAYAASGNPPRRPGGVTGMLVSAGYADFANVFSGWRASSGDAAIMAGPASRRAGLAVVYSENSRYGLYWVMLLDD